MSDVHGTVSVRTRVDGDVVADQTYPSDTGQINSIELPTIEVHGGVGRIEVTITFDPPVAHLRDGVD